MKKIIESLYYIFSKQPNKKKKPLQKAVLLAEDNPLIVRPIKILLEQQGYYVTAVEDGNKTLNYLKSYTYGWVLLDLVLPEVEGIDVVKEYRCWEKQTNKPYLPVFGLTAYPFQEITHVCKEAGMDYLFEKPFKKSSLKLIESFLADLEDTT